MTDTASAAPSEREKFEAWLPPYWPRETYRDDEGDELFRDSWVQGAWMGWQGRAAQPTPPAADQEPFGYFRAEPFGWTDCAETDEGAVALYEHPTPPAVVEPMTDGLLQQHNRDSQELRRLCAARDQARSERDALKAEIAGLEASCSTLGRLVDELRPDAERYQYLRERDLDTIRQGGVFAGRTPDNVVLNGDDLDAAIDAARAQAKKGGAA